MERFYTDVVFSLKSEQGCSIINLKETTVNPDEILSAGPQIAGAVAAPIIGSAIGGLMGGGKGREQQQVVNQAPWSEQVPHLAAIFRDAKAQYAKHMPFYPGAITAPQDPLAARALGLVERQAGQGQQNLMPGLQAIRDTAAGAYLPGGSKDSLFDQAFKAKAAELIPGVDSAFGRSGRGRGGLLKLSTQKVLANALGDQIAKERQRQLQAAAQLPAAEASMYAPYGKMLDVGRERERLEQLGIDEAIQRYEHKYMEPWQRMARYQQMVQGNYGGQTQTPYFMPGRMQQMFGGALGGAQLGQNIFGEYQRQKNAFGDK